MENPDFMIHMMRSHDAIQLYVYNKSRHVDRPLIRTFSNIRLMAKLKFPMGTANKSCLDLSTNLIFSLSLKR